ncbi:MAG: DNA starvation/stationary phase protection protein [Cellvibrionales bacterium]|nr:DNA starvation/stationary phase protection protein [Cellvibrionales bacterium]
MSKLNIGVDEKHKKIIAEELSSLLADSYTLYLQTHNFHWNVVGPKFHDLHLMFEDQYTELAEAVDEIAERIRTLDAPAPGTYKSFSQVSHVKEVEGVPKAEEMIKILKENNELVVESCRKVLKVAQEGEDESTVSLASDRMRIHEKTAWMLNSMVQ